jgi:hypothetical protein
MQLLGLNVAARTLTTGLQKVKFVCSALPEAQLMSRYLGDHLCCPYHISFRIKVKKAICVMGEGFFFGWGGGTDQNKRNLS